MEIENRAEETREKKYIKHIFILSCILYVPKPKSQMWSVFTKECFIRQIKKGASKAVGQLIVGAADNFLKLLHSNVTRWQTRQMTTLGSQDTREYAGYMALYTLQQ